MKLDKTTLKRLIKESIEEMSINVPVVKKQPLVDQVTQQMIEDAINGNEDYLISRNFAAEIAEQHSVPFREVEDELGRKPNYKVSELFGWLGY